MGDCNVKDAMSIFITYNTLRVDYIKKGRRYLEHFFFYLKRLKSLEKFSFLIKYRKIFATQEKPGTCVFLDDAISKHVKK